jgi:Xaa-Pro aminopeptidase
MSIGPSRFLTRLSRLRDEMQLAALDTLVVTHPPNIRYLTGFNGSAGLLVVAGSRCDLVVDFRYGIAARALVRSDPALSGAVNVVVPPQSYDDTLAGLLRDRGALKIGIEAADMSVVRFNRLSAALAAAAPTPLDSPNPCPVLVPTERLVERGRVVKDATEIATLREAGRRIAAVALAVPALVREGRSELDIATDVDAAMRRLGFERPAFETIVASGPNSALPHARPGPRVVAAGDGVVLDFGGVYDGYCVDLTRTVHLGPGRPELRRIFAAVAEAQRAAIAAVRPGVLTSEVDRAARDVLVRHGLGEAFGHGTGHGLGLEVHEEPRIGPAVTGQSETTLQSGMVFTVEPGAYVEHVGGVRIEDDVLVTESGCEVLTRGEWTETGEAATTEEDSTQRNGEPE